MNRALKLTLLRPAILLEDASVNNLEVDNNEFR